MVHKLLLQCHVAMPKLILVISLMSTLVNSSSSSSSSSRSLLHVGLLNVLRNGHSLPELHHSIKSALADVDLSQACTFDSMAYFAAIESLLPTVTVNDNPDVEWAIKLLDATAKVPPLILEGNLRWMGSFSECIKVRAYTQDSAAKERFRGQYCTVGLQLPSSNNSERIIRTNEHERYHDPTKLQGNLHRVLNVGSAPPVSPMAEAGLQLGLCWTSSCNSTEIITMVTVILQIIKMQIKINIPDVIISTSPAECNVEADSPAFDAVNIVVIIVYSLFALVILAATLYEVGIMIKHKWFNSIQTFDTDQQGVFSRALLSFSAYKNGKKILQTGSGNNTLTCIHGIRFLSMTWVVLAHTYMLFLVLPFENLTVILDLVRNYPMQIIFKADFSVDTFYVLSGLLITYLFLNEMKKSDGKFGLQKFFFYYFHRYWRLTPVYAMSIALIVGLSNYLGEGPLWSFASIEQENCRTYWWRNLLYIQNLYDTDVHKCFPVAWYLGTDMQFYVISLPILLALYTIPIIGLSAIGICFAITTIAKGLIVYIRDLPSSMAEDIIHIDAQRMADFVQYVYYPPWCRMGPYLIGMLTGFLIFHNKPNTRIRPFVVTIGWLAAVAMGLTLIFGYTSYVDSDIIMPRWLRALNAAGSKSAWGAVVAWVIYACATGHGGFLNTVLSWKALVPLSRLTYSAYLVHYYIISVFYGTQQTNYYFSQYLLVLLFLGMLVVTMAVAFVFSIAFELPMMELEKIFRDPRKESSEAEEDQSRMPYFGVEQLADHRIPRIGSAVPQ